MVSRRVLLNTLNRFASFRLICGLIAIGAFSSSALGSPTDSMLINSPDRHILTVTPFENFAVDARLRNHVEFWVNIYSKYTTNEGLIHDAKYIDHVYQVVDLTKGDDTDYVRDLKKHWKEVLLSVHRKQKQPDSMTDEEKRVFYLFQDVNEPNKFLNAAHRKRLRFQLGQKDRFLDGLKQSGRYLPMMEEIFRHQGLPIELTRLPFVESSFNVRARSKVGASGIWQFMRSTGRLFLKVNDAVDERNDPIRATEAAAQLLHGNYESLGKWPLAVTAYNHGRKGMMRAVRMVGSEELEDVVGGYRASTFGFASSNFFTELLAAIEVERNADKYFGKVDRAKPVPSVEVKLPDYIDYRELCRFMKYDPEALKELNPGLTEFVLTGQKLVPAGYTLRLPYDGKISKEATAGVFMAGYAEIPALYKLQAQRAAKYANKRIKRTRH